MKGCRKADIVSASSAQNAMKWSKNDDQHGRFVEQYIEQPG